MYCIYTDKDVPPEKGNLDHVYPLSLGGTNTFVVWANLEKNSVMGSEVDGALANDPLLAFALRDSGVRGHGKTERVPRWRKGAMDDGRPIQVTLGKEQITVWDARANRNLDEAEVANRQMTATLRIGKDTALRFIAKAALGGGYFVYGDAIRSAVNCDHLRELIFLDAEKSRQQGTLEHSGIAVCDRFHPDSRGSGRAVLYRALCEGMKRSLFIAIPHNHSISFHVGIVGMYIGSMIVPAKTNELPLDGDHDLGHAIVLAPGAMERLSLRALVLDFQANFDAAIAKANQQRS
jgi:hypothetical protein